MRPRHCQAFLLTYTCLNIIASSERLSLRVISRFGDAKYGVIETEKSHLNDRAVHCNMNFVSTLNINLLENRECSFLRHKKITSSCTRNFGWAGKVTNPVYEKWYIFSPLMRNLAAPSPFSHVDAPADDPRPSFLTSRPLFRRRRGRSTKDRTCSVHDCTFNMDPRDRGGAVPAAAH